MAKKPIQTSSFSVEKVAMIIVVVAVLFFVGRYAYQEITGTEASTVKFQAEQVILLSDKGNDDNDGSYNFPIRSFRRAIELAETRKGDILIGSLDTIYTIPELDTEKDISQPPITIERDGNTIFSGVKLAGQDPRGNYLYAEAPIAMTLPDYSNGFSLIVRANQFAVRNIDFELSSPIYIDTTYQANTHVANNEFGTTSPSLTMLFQSEAFVQGVAKITNNEFHFPDVNPDRWSKIALSVHNQGGLNQHVLNNKFYFNTVGQRPDLNYTTAFFPFIGVDGFGNLIDVNNNTFISGTEGLKSNLTEYAKSNLGIRYQLGEHGSFIDNDFKSFTGTPILIETPSESNRFGQSALVAENH